MKIKQLEKRLLAELKEQFAGADGFVRLDTITIDLEFEKTYIVIKGAYGAHNADGNVAYQREFEIEYPDGKNADYIAGVFATMLMHEED